MKKQTNKKVNKSLIWAIVCVAVVVLAVVMIWLGTSLGDRTPEETVPPESTEEQNVETVTVDQPLGKSLTVRSMGPYTGLYMEDGSDEMVSNVLMLEIENTGDYVLQYAEVTLPVGDAQAQFSLSTLFPGEKTIVLEKNRVTWSADAAYGDAEISNEVYFDQAPGLQADMLQAQLLDGGMNVTNVSGQDITGTIVIYYKNYQDGMYYGGITYRVRLEEGLQADQTIQIMSEHVHAENTKIVFITIS